MPDVLPWFPYDVDDWEEMTKVLTLEEEGALVRLIRAAWRDPVPCTLYDSPVFFERLLGRRWKHFRPLIDEHFHPDPDIPGRIRCQWLTVLYTDQAHRYRKRVERNERHRVKLNEKLRRLEAEEDETPLKTPPATSSVALAETSHETPPETHGETHRETSHETVIGGPETSPPLRAKSLELRGASPTALTSSGLEAPSQGRALGLERPRAASEERPVNQPPVASPSAAKERAYFARLRDKVARFKGAHPDRYEEVVVKIRLNLGLPRGKPVPAWYQQQFDDQVLVAVRELHPDWPSSAEDWKPESEEMSA